jgi:acyl CoA:acetate/3-ketoacid CoA transferase alpha subunit
VGVFDNTGIPGQLIEALREHGATNLVVVSNGAGSGD